MNDISMVPMYVPIIVSLAILMVPGVVIESYWWWNDRRLEREANLRRAEVRPVRGPLTREEQESSAA
jgi:hypothetical protein